MKIQLKKTLDKTIAVSLLSAFAFTLSISSTALHAAAVVAEVGLEELSAGGLESSIGKNLGESIEGNASGGNPLNAVESVIGGSVNQEITMAEQVAGSIPGVGPVMGKALGVVNKVEQEAMNVVPVQAVVADALAAAGPVLGDAMKILKNPLNIKNDIKNVGKIAKVGVKTIKNVGKDIGHGFKKFGGLFHHHHHHSAPKPQVATSAATNANVATAGEIASVGVAGASVGGIAVNKALAGATDTVTVGDVTTITNDALTGVVGSVGDVTTITNDALTGVVDSVGDVTDISNEALTNTVGGVANGANP